MPRDVSWDELVRLAATVRANGGHFYQKWTCELCGERASMNKPDGLWTSGLHEEKEDGSPCGHVTELLHRGGGLMAYWEYKG